MQLSIQFDPATELDEVTTLLAALGDTPVVEAVAAPKAAAKKTAATRTKAPEPEEPEDDADLIGGDDEDEETEAATMADIVKLATDMVNSGSAPRVKAALAKRKAKRVSEIKPAQIQGFFDELSADED